MLQRGCSISFTQAMCRFVICAVFSPRGLRIDSQAFKIFKVPFNLMWDGYFARLDFFSRNILPTHLSHFQIKQAAPVVYHQRAMIKDFYLCCAAEACLSISAGFDAAKN